MNDVEHTKKLLATLTANQRRELFEYLRVEFPIHAIETQLNARAEVILEAISRASDLTRRGIRGVIAEAAFETYVVTQLQDWTKLSLVGDFSYDFLLKDSAGSVRVQVKMQRLKNHEPMTAQQAYRCLPADMFVVETQRTRGGLHPTTGADTRPYSFGEFDVLAVSMHPSTNNWAAFMYTVADWLIPRSDNSALMLKFQPVAVSPSNSWTDDFETCVQWMRGRGKQPLLGK